MKKITTIILLVLSFKGYSQQTIKVAGGGTSGGATEGVYVYKSTGWQFAY